MDLESSRHRPCRLPDWPSMKTSWKEVLHRWLGVGPPRVDERNRESSRWNVPLPPAGGALHTSVAAAVPERSDFNFWVGNAHLRLGLLSESSGLVVVE